MSDEQCLNRFQAELDALMEGSFAAEGFRLTKQVRALACVAALAGCSSPFGPTPCPATSEWGTNGCAQVVVVVEEPGSEVPRPYFLTVSARLDDGGVISHAPEPRFGAFLMTIDLGPTSSLKSGDTASVWLIASLVSTASELLEDPIVASDSVVKRLGFVGMGEVPALDTARLTPK